MNKKFNLIKFNQQVQNQLKMVSLLNQIKS